MIARMFKDARDAPRRFWETYAIMLVFMATVAWSVGDAGWFGLLIGIVAAWGIFAGLMGVYALGQHVAYRRGAEWAEDARRSMLEGHAELEEISRRLDSITRQFPEGPS